MGHKHIFYLIKQTNNMMRMFGKFQHDKTKFYLDNYQGKDLFY